MSAVLSDEPAVFPDAISALRHCYRFDHEQYQTSGLTELASGPRPFGRGLGGLDGAGTVGIVFANLATLPQLWRRLLAARYMPRKVKCLCMRSCCMRWKWNDRRLYEMAWLTETVFLDLKLPLLRDRRHAKEALIAYCFKDSELVTWLLDIEREDESTRLTQEQLADALHMHRHTFRDYHSQLANILSRERRSAESAMEERLISAGLVG